MPANVLLLHLGLASFALTDMLNGISSWFHDDGEMTIGEVAEDYVDLAVHRLLGSRP
ncbi:MAG: hypothetical protein WBQ44_01430 [Rhodococcus sp. (in: high G+C Gram-positive bacteria)]